MTLVKAKCPTCGTVFITVDELACAIQLRRREALCQFECPVCAVVVTQELVPFDVAILRSMGASLLNGTVPFELVENHFGPPLCLDDLLDFHEAISGEISDELREAVE